MTSGRRERGRVDHLTKPPADPMERRPAASSLNQDSLIGCIVAALATCTALRSGSFPKPKTPPSMSITQKRIYIDLKRPSMSIPSEEAIAFTAKCGSSALQPDDHGHINNTSATAERALK